MSRGASSVVVLIGRVVGIAGSVWLGTLAFGIASHASRLGSVRWGTTAILAVAGLVIALVGFWVESRVAAGSPER